MGQEDDSLILGQFPLLTDTETIAEFLARISRLITHQNVLKTSQIFYDTLKLVLYRLRSKCEKTGKKIDEVALKDKEITGFLRIIDYFHTNIRTIEVDGPLRELFGEGPTESECWKFFEKFVEGEVNDKFGRRINVDPESLKFMYKDLTGKHIVKTESFRETRGKRLPWIRKTIQDSSCIFRRIENNNEQLMYIMRYLIRHKAGETIDSFIVVVSKNRQAKNSPYEFKTAYSFGSYNRVIKKIEPCTLPEK